MSGAVHGARVASGGAVLAERLRLAHTHWARLRGLLGTKRLDPGHGLWLRPCRQIHMFGMRYAVDAVFLDEHQRVVRSLSELSPWRVSPRVADAESVLELPAGTVARTRLAKGAQVVIEGCPVAPRRPPGSPGSAGRCSWSGRRRWRWPPSTSGGASDSWPRIAASSSVALTAWCAIRCTARTRSATSVTSSPTRARRTSWSWARRCSC